jgi:hypothetical protein
MPCASLDVTSDTASTKSRSPSDSGVLVAMCAKAASIPLSVTNRQSLAALSPRSSGWRGRARRARRLRQRAQARPRHARPDRRRARAQSAPSSPRAELKHWAAPLTRLPNRLTYHVIEALDPAAALIGFARRNTSGISPPARAPLPRRAATSAACRPRSLPKRSARSRLSGQLECGRKKREVRCYT